MTDAVFFGVNFKSRSQCEKLNKQYRQGGYIAKGAYGKVYEVCHKEDCKYVLKVIKYDHSVVTGQSFDEFQEKWTHEVDMHLAMMQCESSLRQFRFTTSLIDAWFCQENGYF
jgi:hypothetical protein